MVARAALISLLLVAGCGGDDSTGAGGNNSDLGVVGDVDMGAACADVTVTASSPYPPTVLTAWINSSGADPLWSAMVTGSSAPLPVDVDPSGRTATLTATSPGTYSFYVHFPQGQPCVAGPGSYTVNDPGGVTTLYRVRLLPPSGLALAPTDHDLELVGGTPVANKLFVVNGGTSVTGFLTGPGGSPVTGEVRFVGTRVPDADVRTDTSGAFALAISTGDLYTPLLIPDAPTLAPHLGVEGSGGIFIGSLFSVGSGAPVTGSISDGANPIAGANVVLRAGLLPSGVGTSAADGTFSLRAEALPASTPYALAVSSDGWPTLTLDQVVVPAAGLGVTVAYTVARVAVTGTVNGSDQKALAGARVTIASADAIPAAANVTIGGSTQVASGRVTRVLTSDATGALPLLTLPPGDYVVTVEPPAGSPDGLTRLPMTAPGDWTLTLQPPQPLAVHVHDGNGHGVSGARVTATALSGLGAAPTTMTDSGGVYQLLVGSGTASSVRVEPPASANLGDALVFVAAGAPATDVTLGPGLQVSGGVVGPSGTPLPAVLLEALCWACDSPTVLATTVSDSHGQYRLYLPDPGQRSVDAGTD